MVFDVLALALLLGGAYLGWQETRRAGGPGLPPDDLPPPAAGTPLPRHGRLGGYVSEGLDDIDEFLARRERPDAAAG